jgi:hypothetical protein
MKPCLKASLTLAALLTVALPGFTEIDGTRIIEVSVSSVSEEAGSVLVMRGTETLSVKAGDTLFEGDMILTRSEGRVTLSFGDTCSRELSGLQSLTVSADFCERLIADVDTEASASGGNVSQTAGILGDTSGVVLPAIGVLAGVAVVAAAASGEDEDQPTSP